MVFIPQKKLARSPVDMESAITVNAPPFFFFFLDRGPFSSLRPGKTKKKFWLRQGFRVGVRVGKSPSDVRIKEDGCPQNLFYEKPPLTPRLVYFF